MAIRLFSAALLLGMLTPIAAAAQSWPALDEAPQVEQSGTEDVAVLVAVEDYVFMPDVAGARQNVAEWEAFLRDGLGVKTVLTLVNEQAVREELLDAAEKAVDEAGEGSTVWYVFIGHGAPAPDGADGFLVGADAQQNPKSIEARGLRRGELIERLEAGPQKRTVVLFDACFSGQTADGPLAEGIQPVVPVSPAPTNAPGTVVLSAAQSDEFAGQLPGAERPAFSYLVLGGLRGWADDGDQQVTAAEAVEFARRELLALPGRRQTPEVRGLSNAILSSGAVESAPQKRSVATGSPVGTTDAGPSGDSGEPTVVHWRNGRPVDPSDPAANSLLSVSVGGGLAAELAGVGATPLVDGLIGIRLGRGAQLRLAVGLSYFNRENPWAREYDKAADRLESDFDVSLPSLENGLRTHLLGMAVGPGWALRPADAGLGISIDTQLGLAVAPAGQCSEWGERGGCSDTDGVVDPLFGLRMGLGYNWLEVAVLARAIPTTDINITSTGEVQELGIVEVYSGLTLGLTFDI